MKKIFSFILRHKIISLIILTVIITGSYFGYQKINTKENGVSYTTSTVEKGMLISSISGIGQVSASNQVDIKSKVSGDIVSVTTTVGQEVKIGQTLVYINATDALKSVRDAKTSLETAQLELEEILEPVDELTLLQAESSLISAKESKQKAIDSLEQTYEDSFNTISNAFLDLPTIMTGLNNILFDHSFNGMQSNIDYYGDTIKTFDSDASQIYRTDAYNKYQTARTSYDTNSSNYKSASRFSKTEVIENLISETYDTTKNIAESIKSANNLIRLYQDELAKKSIPSNSMSDTHLTSLSSYTSKTNSYLSSLLSSKSSIQNNQESIISADRTIKEKELSLAKTKAGSDELSIRAKKITVQQKQDALLSAQQTLADYSIRAPFDGIIAESNSVKGDTISSGTTIATLITNQKIAEITLNEIDVAQVKTGQKTTLTFDAVSDLSITGEVVEVDTLGIVNQGVVSYDIKIAFDVQDERVKPGMTVSVNIITESKQNVLLVPLSAVKTMGTNNYVEVLVDGQPQRKTVVVGSSNDTVIEIMEGLEDGEEIIIQTMTNGDSTQNQNSDKNQRAPGGMMRMF